MDIAAVQDEIVEEFEMMPDWQDRYAYIISLGKELPAFPQDKRIDQNKVKGCQSNVWLFPRQQPDGSVCFDVDSDALIVKGLAALLMRVYSCRQPDEIIAAEPVFITRIGLGQHLSPTRSNGLAAMLRQVKLYAIALKAMQSKQT